MTQHAVRLFQDKDTTALVDLWGICDLTRPWNDAHADIAFCVKSQSSCLFVAQNSNGAIIGSVMVGSDGHRGWYYYLAVAPENRRQGIGKQLLTVAEQWLKEQGVPKAQLMIRAENDQAVSFYESVGYTEEDRIIMSKRLI